MDELLEQRISEAKDCEHQTEKYTKAITDLVDAVLHLRQFCRPQKGQPLSGIYLELYERLQQQLTQEVHQNLEKYNPNKISGRIWAKEISHQTIGKILDDEQLKKLALEAQQQPPESESRRYALRELVEAIRLSGRLCRPHRQMRASSPQFYELIYQEAVNQTLAYVYQKIDNYDPDRGKKKFMNWVNFYLDKFILKCRRQFKEPLIEDIPSLNGLDNLPQSTSPPSTAKDVRDYIEADPKQIFAQKHIRNHPEASFRAIALLRFADRSWKEISADFKIPIPTLSRFFQRSCEQFRSSLREDLCL